MKSFLYLILNVSITLAAKAKGTTKPHIVFCLIDDLGWNDVSFHGSRQIPTPNIDILAANGVVLNNYYTQPLCTPSRASLLTGVYPIRYGLHYSVLQLAEPAGLSLNYTILPQHLKSLGYKTYAIGKWHLGFFHKEYTPLYRGFDSFFGYWTGKMDYYTHVDEEEPGFGTGVKQAEFWGRALRRNMDYADEYNGTYATTLFTTEAVNVIQEHDMSKPLFMYLSHLAVHTGNDKKLFQAPEKYVNQFKHIKDKERRTFAAMTAAMDDSIGEVFRALHEKRMLDNTIFIFSTDNGGEGAGFRGGVGSNWPLRGNKGTTWEGGVRGTAFLWSPLIKKMPRISNQFMSIQDWLPTLYHAAGGDVADLGNIDGQNIWDALLDDSPSPRTELLINIDPVDDVETMRRGDYKLVIENFANNNYSGWFGPSGRDNGISEEEYKMKLDNCSVTEVLKKRGVYTKVKDLWLSELNIRCNHSKNGTKECQSREKPCLYNITEDPCETTNVADQHPEMVEKMLDLLDEYKKSAVPPLKEVPDPASNPAHFDNHWTNWADLL